MNSYNENLRSSVVTSLNNQELDLKKADASRNAAMFSLYYAEGARITAAENLEIVTRTYEKQQKIQEQMTENSNISVNLLDAAIQEKNYVSQAVSNTAVGASNVQIAANAILSLASDIGSIFSIVNAADFDTQIYEQALDAYNYMNDTAYMAEVASQLAMEGSMLTSQVSSDTVAQEATTTNTSVKNLLDNLTNQFNKVSAEMTADNDALALASTTEKKAEGVLEDLNVEFFATQSAYLLSNKELNINLLVPENVKGKEVCKSNIFYTVNFNQLKSPFEIKGTKRGYPVDDYYILLVKNMNQSTFSLTMAEALIDNPDQCVKVSSVMKDGQQFFSEKIFISQLKDSDGDAMDLGTEYVIFVFAKLSESYKKALNNFEDFLSASSPEFSLFNVLSAPKHDNITYSENDKAVEFSLTEDDNYKVEYRLMLLPDTRKLVQGLLTQEGLRSLEKEVEKLEQIAEKYDPEILRYTQDVNSLEVRISAIPNQIAVLEDELDQAQTKKDKDRITKEISNLNEELDKEKEALVVAKRSLKKSIAGKKIAEKAIQPNQYSKPGFFFNLTLANMVPAGSYHSVTDHELKRVKKGDKIHVSAKVKIHADLTDNFGNKLVDDIEYTPVILSVSKESEEDVDQFVNALSDFANTNHFEYKS